MRARRPPIRTLAVGLGAALAILAVLLYAVGPGKVLGALATADRAVLVLVLVVTVAWMAAWSRSLYLVLRLLGVPTTRRRSFLVYSTLQLLANVVPFSVAGAQPLAALVVSRSTGESYERSFAVTASVDVVNYLPAPALAALGLLYFAVTASLGRTLAVGAATMVALFLLVFLVAVLVWRNRRRIADGIPRLLGRVETRLGGSFPAVLRRDSLQLDRRIEAGLEALERVAGDRPTLVQGVATSALGWALLSSILWLSLYAVGAVVPLAVPLFVVPVATVTNLLPLPGGVGSVDATLVLLLVLTTGLPAATVTAAVIVHRAATVLIPVVVGSTSAVVLR